ncbi:hypothetical protein [Nocardia sp. CA-145437]
MLNSRGPDDYLEPPLADFEEKLKSLQDLALFLQRTEPQLRQTP